METTSCLTPETFFYSDNTLEFLKSSEVSEKSSVKYNQELLKDFIDMKNEGLAVYREVFRYVERFLKNYHDAQDAMNEIHLKVWRKRDMYNPSRNLRSWLFVIAKNCCIDHQRKGRKFDCMLSLERDVGNNIRCDTGVLLYNSKIPMSPLEKIELEDDIIRVNDCMDKLPNKYKDIVLLSYFRELKYREIAEELGIPEGTVKSRLFVAKVNLKRMLGE